MSPRRWLLKVATMMVPGFVLAGCFDKPPSPEEGTVVFRGAFSTGFEPMAFAGSRLNALSIDDYETLDGFATIRIDVPPSSATPGFAGGPFQAAVAQDLSASTALTFWAKAARPAVLDKVGFGLAFVPFVTSHEVTVFGLPVDTQWTQHVIPIPDPSRLDAEHGLFWYADSDPGSYSFWLADVKFSAVPAAQLDLQPGVTTSALTVVVGKKAAVPITLSYADVDGTRREVDADSQGAGPMVSFFSFDSSDWSIAAVDVNGNVTGVAVGDAVISATLGSLAPSTLTVTVVDSLPAAPTAGPPAPTQAASAVKSIFSNAYTSVPGVAYHTDWSSVTSFSTVSVGGNAAHKYVGLNYMVLDFTSNKIDASGMAYFHVDLWTPNATKFGVKLVSFPASGGAPEVTVAFNERTAPPITPSTWISLDIPLSRFAGVPLDTLGQIVWLDNSAVSPGGDEAGTFWMDNIYFHE